MLNLQSLAGWSLVIPAVLPFSKQESKLYLALAFLANFRAKLFVH